MSWNLGDIFDTLGEAVPGDSPALLHGESAVSWTAFTRRTNNLAAALRAGGARPGDKVALYLRNRPEYLETTVACFKARLVHVNVNFRYLADELQYIIDNADAKFVVFAGEFADRLDALRPRLPKVQTYLQVDDGTPFAPFAEAYEPLAAEGSGTPLGIERSPDDLLFLYTGGTTGMPKGVMWRSEDLWGALGGGGNPVLGEAPVASLDDLATRVRARGPGFRHLPACPLMHGTGLFTALITLGAGGAIATLPGVNFDPHELWQAVGRQAINTIAIVGDAFAKPMLRALDERRGDYRLDTLLSIISSGVMWSPEVKPALLAHHTNMILFDSVGSSEAVGFGASSTTAAGESRTGRFQLAEKVKVFTEDGREVQPGSDESGVVAHGGPIPVGYYKDPEKTARTFRVINGVRYVIPGDWCEVEEMLKTHPAVYDAVVVGVPDEKWGQAVVGVVELNPGTRVSEEEIRAHVRQRLAGFKTPKRVLVVESIGRAANGKADYAGMARLAEQRLAGPAA
ncbi:MAG: acyl-CoA synthetase [Deltaproteobacteria bacterium]|nr:MAG: acyl-CoA synthetase [Deltaproteobacteria bacterium]